jgi:hypothetical protein
MSRHEIPVTSSNVRETVKPPTRSLLRVVCLVLPVWLALAVEMIGGWRFGKDMYSGNYAINLRGQYSTLIWTTLGALIISPLLVVGALEVHRNRDNYAKGLYRALLLLLTFCFLISKFNCAWSCGGHPTWTSGYR